MNHLTSMLSARQGYREVLAIPIRRASNDRFHTHELKRIEKIVQRKQEFLLEHWNEFFKK